MPSNDQLLLENLKLRRLNLELQSQLIGKEHKELSDQIEKMENESKKEEPK